MIHGFDLIFGGLAACGCLYWLAVAFLVMRYGRKATADEAIDVPVTILKPLHGAEPGLAENLMSFVRQDYAAPVRIVFGIQDPADPALPVAEAIIRAMPERNMAVIVNGRRYGSNPKISNLINMMPAARDAILVIADSDIRVGPDYLARIVATLHRPGVGAVTCAYHGGTLDRLWSRIAGMAVDGHFLPGVVACMAGRLAVPCFGATIALRRDVLERIGGFETFSNVLADDYAIGRAVRQLDLDVAVTPFLVTHMCNDATFGEVLRHEIRWAKTVAGLNRIGFVGTGLTHAVPLAILTLALSGSAVAGGLVLAALMCRCLLLISVTRRFNLAEAAFWLLPLRDCLSFYVYLASFFPSDIDWRGSHFLIETDGTMAARQEGE